jgi:replicative DNA helicase
MGDRLANTDAEKEILAGILSDPLAFHKVSGIVKAGDFYRQDYHFLFETMADMILRGETVDYVTMIEAIRARMQGREEDGHNLRMTLRDIGQLGKCYTLEDKAEIVAGYSRRRRLIAKARELAEMAKDLEQEPNVSTFCNDLEGIDQRAEKDTGDMGAAILELKAILNRRETSEGIETGLDAIDGYIGGFEPGELITIAGRPGHGKSALAGTIAINLSQKGKKILIFSLEMGMGELAGRFVSRLANVPGDVMKRPARMTAGQKAAIQKGMDELHALPITINTQESLTPGDIASTAARVKRGAGLDAVIVDYLQLMSSGRKGDAGNRVQEISYITRTLKNLAKRLELPIILLSQLSRANEKEKGRDGRPRLPQLTDLRDSGSIEQDSNTVLLLQRELDQGELSQKTAVNIAKQRNGKTGVCYIEFVTNYSFFTAYDASIEVPY